MMAMEESAVANAVRIAVMSMGLEQIRSGEFFGMKQPRGESRRSE